MGGDGLDDEPSPDDEPPPGPAANDLAGWEEVVEMLADRVLWDRDFENEDMVEGLEPECVAEVLHLSRIPDGYFTTPAPLASPAQVSRALDYLHKLT